MGATEATEEGFALSAELSESLIDSIIACCGEGLKPRCVLSTSFSLTAECREEREFARGTDGGSAEMVGSAAGELDSTGCGVGGVGAESGGADPVETGGVVDNLGSAEAGGCEESLGSIASSGASRFTPWREK